MRRKEFIEYERKMNSITDDEALKKAMQENEFKLKSKAKLPIYGGLSGSLASIALFLLTGILSGWTVGVLWVVATIMGAGVLASTASAIVARHKYAVFNRAMRTRKKILEINQDGRDYTAMERANLECRLRKDLQYLNKKRLISTREKDIYGQVMRPIIARGGSERDVRLAEIQAQAETYNMTMDHFASDVREVMAKDVEANEDRLDAKEDNIDKDTTFDGSIKISSQSRNTITGAPLVDSEGNPVFDKYAQFNATSDKEVVMMLRGISQVLKQRSNKNAMPYPIKIEAKGFGDIVISSWGADGLVINGPEGTILCDGGNGFDNLAKDIFSKLPDKAPEAAAEAAPDPASEHEAGDAGGMARE